MKIFLITIFAYFFAFVSPVLTQERTIKDNLLNNETAKNRLALVIGNGDYEKISSLSTPVNDANDMADALRSLGYNVMLGINSNKKQMAQLVRDFGKTLAGQKGVGLFYYAGHAIQYESNNFLIPVDAETVADEDTFMSGTMDVTDVLDKMNAAGNRANIVILNASRNNPFDRNSLLGLAQIVPSTRSIYRKSSSGLAVMMPSVGTIIAYSTAPKGIAFDSAGRNSIYTQELIKSLKVPNIQIETALLQTKVFVAELTQSKQNPWDTSALEKVIYVAGTQQTARAKPSATQSSPPIQKPPQNEHILRSDVTDLSANTTSSTSGRYFALVIGINNYKNKDIQRLSMAETDAKAVASTLQNSFGFQTKLLLNENANRQEMFTALFEYNQTLTESDSLLIYYAGHGYYDKDTDNAYWLPVEADKKNRANWLSDNDITSSFRANPAKHILIVADSCYSGALTRTFEPNFSEPLARERLIKRMMERKSRNLMASGGNEPVLDGGGGNHSVFASAFLRGLMENGKNIFSATELFYDDVREAVVGRANQTPEYKFLINSGHNSGDFIFVRKQYSTNK